MSDFFDAISSESCAFIVEELTRRDPALLAELRGTHKPTDGQSNAVERVLIHALSANYGPGHVPNEYGLAIERAIGAYFEAWPMSG